MKSALFVLIFSMCASASEYIYQFSSNVIPKTRLEKESGRVDVYSNLQSIKFTEKMLRSIHREHHKNITYESFLEKMKRKYPTLTFKSEERFRWVEYNEFLETQKLNDFSVDLH